jgi:uncharacterized repeat protein (TIGR01451 family)
MGYSLLAAIAPSKAWAGDLEFSVGSYPSPPNGPALSAGPATLLENTTGSTFIPYAPATTIGISISNQQYAGGLQLGTIGAASPVFNKLNFYGGPTDAMFTSNPNGTAGTGVVGNDNYAYQLYASVQPLIGLPNNARYYYGDVTLTFNHPVSDPVIHMSGMGGNSTLTATTPHGHSAEMELITPGIIASKLSGSNFLNVTGNKMLNSATTITASCATGAACGSVKFAGTNITSLTFKVYVRGDAGTAPWSGGDVFLFGGTSIAKPVTISGTVFNDVNGLADSLINGTGSNAGGLFANLVDTNGKVIASTAVATNGTYSFLGIGAGQYTVSLSTTAGVQGSIAPPTSLPATWSNTGEGTAAGGDGLVDGKTSLTVAAANLSGVNFGIQQQLVVNQPPDTTPLNPPSQPNPGGTATVQVPTLAGTDLEDGPLGLGKSFKIESLPTNGTLSYNNAPVLAGQIISSYDPTLLKLDPDDGAITVSFTYAAIDSAGKEDLTPAIVTMPFSVAGPIFGAGPGASCSIGSDIVTNGHFDQFSGGQWPGWSTTNAWITNTPSFAVAWEDINVTTLTQTSITNWNRGTGSYGAALIDLTMKWSNGDPLPSNTASWDVEVGGVRYARLTTPTGYGTIATITYSNGATGNVTTMTAGINTNWQIELPANVAATGNLTFRHTPTGAVGISSDDFYLDRAVVKGCNPNLLLVKRLTAINGGNSTIAGDSLAGYIDEPTNAYDDNIITIPTQSLATAPPRDTDKWPNPMTTLIGGINGGNVKLDDEIEYTIYFLSAGDVDAKNVLFCDRVPDNVSFLFNGYAGSSPLGITGTEKGIQLLQNGITTNLSNVPDGDIGQYFPPGVNPAGTYPKINCRGANTNGAIVVNLGTLLNATAPGTPNSSYGFVKFKGKVK